MEQRTATIIPFPGPRQKTLLDLAEASQTRLARGPASVRQLSEHEVDHRRRMLMHLQCSRDATHAR